MMPGLDAGMGGWGFTIMSLGSLVFLALMGIVGWLLLRTTTSDESANRMAGGRDAVREILAERYARGEIDEPEYHRLLETLGSKDPTRLGT